MFDADDMALLRKYDREGSEAAFAELVRRHVNMVYSVAWRRTGNAQDAEDVTQVVFTILAQKAGRLHGRTALTGWLYETTRFASSKVLRAKIRREAREQEAFMQSTPHYSEPEQAWRQLAPHLEEAMSSLGETDRALVALRFFQYQSGAQAAAALGMREWAAHKRVSRAVEKLRLFFARRGITLPAGVLVAAITAHSVQAAPSGLGTSVAAAAAAKGIGAGAATSALIKGTLKLMAWTKMKTAVVVGAGLILAGGAATVTITEIHEHQTYPWQVPKFDYIPTDAPALLGRTPPQVRIVRSKFDHWVAGTPFTQGDMTSFVDGKIVHHTNEHQSIGLGVKADAIVKVAYDSEDLRTVFATPMPEGLFDFIANLSEGAMPVLQEEIKKKLGLVGRREMVETNVLALTLAGPEARGLLSATSLMQSVNITNLNPFETEDGTSRGDTNINRTIEQVLRRQLENILQIPVVDETGLTNRYDFVFQWPVIRSSNDEDVRRTMNEALSNQLGLTLVPARRQIPMLVVEKVRN